MKFRGLVSLKANWLAFSEVARLLRQYHRLTLEMAKREITERYSGQIFGALWAIGHPLFMIGLYVFVFAFVFKTKVGGTLEMPLDYTAYILAGLIPWMAFQESMNKACVAITSSASLVKQITFPIEVLAVKGVLASLMPQFISSLVLICYVLVTHGSLPWTYLFLPFLITLQTIAMMGVAFILSSISVFLRDVKDLVQLFCMAGVYLMPAFYLPQWVPNAFKPILFINPFSYLTWCYQDLLYYGRFQHPWAWLVVIAGSFFVFIFGFRLFRRLKPIFGNVL